MFMTLSETVGQPTAQCETLNHFNSSIQY